MHNVLAATAISRPPVRRGAEAATDDGSPRRASSALAVSGASRSLSA